MAGQDEFHPRDFHSRCEGDTWIVTYRGREIGRGRETLYDMFLGPRGRASVPQMIVRRFIAAQQAEKARWKHVRAYKQALVEARVNRQESRHWRSVS